jgi:hypothetical protein
MQQKALTARSTQHAPLSWADSAITDWHNHMSRYGRRPAPVDQQQEMRDRLKQINDRIKQLEGKRKRRRREKKAQRPMFCIRPRLPNAAALLNLCAELDTGTLLIYPCLSIA